mmetsp:Transcript_19704/g.50061  ORF Transcript_19704/g.50061 Transcript_19704/m.50061 type:complete len:279 (+) Transcript_19704:788-1624(+)
MRPSPLPSCAPSMRPGRSASTVFLGPPDARTPRLGMRVVKGYGATSGAARVSALSSDDLPALGKPTMPTSATTRSSRCSDSCCPGAPCVSSFQLPSSTATTSVPCACARISCRVRAATFCWREGAVTPMPPRPPRATTSLSPGLMSSPSTTPLLRRLTTVPGGTGMTKGAVRALRMSLLFLGPPLPAAGLPLGPLGAVYCLRVCRCSRLSYVGSHCSTTSAPSDPSDGSLAGSQIFLDWLPPGLYLRLVTHRPVPACTISPWPPSPDLTTMKTSSNIL